MTETTTSTNNLSTFIVNTTNYWRTTGIVVGALAVIGILLNVTSNANALGFIHFGMTQAVLHLILAVVALTFGFTTVMADLSVTMSKVFGFIYVALGVIGFVMGNVAGIGLEATENIIYILVGAWALVAGFKA